MRTGPLARVAPTSPRQQFVNFRAQFLQVRMSNPAACFENIIGLSRTPCPCVEDLTVEATVSESGLYLDELDGLDIRMANAGINCGQGTLWEMLATALANAIEQTKNDLMACLASETDMARQPTATPTQIGDDKKAQGDGPRLNSGYHGLTMEVANVRGGIAKVTSIGMALKNPVGTYTVYVYDRESLLYTISDLPATANRVTWTPLPAPLELEMEQLGTTPARYWFLFVPTSGLQAMNSRLKCNCGGFQPYWDLSRPQYWANNNSRTYRWADWCQVSGSYGNDIDERETWNCGLDQTQGILLQMTFDCDQETTFCPDAPNYQTDPIQKALAHTVRYRAAANLVTRLLSSVDINIYTMTAGDIMEKNRREWDDIYGRTINEYLCPLLADPKNVNRYGDCNKCRDKWGIQVRPIRN